MVNIRELLEISAVTYIKNRFKIGVVPNECDISDLLDSFLGKEERKLGKEMITEEEFEKFLDELSGKLLFGSHIYKRGDWQSYLKLVRNKNLISEGELSYMRLIASTKNPVRVNNSEFPLDRDGRYTEPKEISLDGYSTKLTSRKDDILFNNEVASYGEEE